MKKKSDNGFLVFVVIIVKFFIIGIFAIMARMFWDAVETGVPEIIVVVSLLILIFVFIFIILVIKLDKSLFNILYSDKKTKRRKNMNALSQKLKACFSILMGRTTVYKKEITSRTIKGCCLVGCNVKENVIDRSVLKKCDVIISQGKLKKEKVKKETPKKKKEKVEVKKSTKQSKPKKVKKEAIKKTSTKKSSVKKQKKRPKVKLLRIKRK